MISLTFLCLILAFIFSAITVAQGPRSLLAWAVLLIAAVLLFPYVR